MPVHRFNAPLDDDVIERIAEIERSGERIVGTPVFDRHNNLWIVTEASRRGDALERRGGAA